jgi:hypothetical protein
MRRAQLGVVIAAALAVATGRAHGQAEVWDGAGRGYIHVPGLAAGGGGLPSRVIFVNDCKPNGCPIVPGNFRLADDSRQNISSIVRPVSTSDPYATRRLAPYTGTAAAWQATIDCVRAAYAPFDVTVVTTEPPPSTSYFEVMAAGLPADIGFPSSVVGVASFACGVIPNAISFAFLNRNPGNVLDACWTVAQQAAHSVGLAHEVLPGDVMSASFSPPEKTFRNQLACIGATGCCEPSQECACGVTDQNSFAALVGLFGPAGPDAACPDPAPPGRQRRRRAGVRGRGRDRRRQRDRSRRAAHRRRRGPDRARRWADLELPGPRGPGPRTPHGRDPRRRSPRHLRHPGDRGDRGARLRRPRRLRQTTAQAWCAPMVAAWPAPTSPAAWARRAPRRTTA